MATWIRTEAQLDDLVDELSRVRAIGLDTEADSLHHYTEKVCLIQVSAHGGGSWLVDPLALPDLTPLAPLLADPSIVKVVHGGENDVMSLRRDFGFGFETLFDTAIAARLLGDREVGLQALVRNELGLELDKGSQRDDWSRRPLTAKQEAYALGDVAHLMALATRLTARLAAAGRTEWAREEFAALAELPPAEKRSGPDEFRRIKGSSALSPRKQAVLRELHQWREARAAEAVPGIAVVNSSDLDEVERVLARYPRAAREADLVLDAIERGLDLPDNELPVKPRNERPRRSQATLERVDALRAWRVAEAERSGLDVSIVMPQRLLERIADAGPETLDELAAVDGVRRWRVSAWGPALLTALDA